MSSDLTHFALPGSGINTCTLYTSLCKTTGHEQHRLEDTQIQPLDQGITTDITDSRNDPTLTT
jgi:hypothetical protein